MSSLTRDGAMVLARRLQQFWLDQGYAAVRFWTEPLDERFEKIGTYEVYQVKCNLVNGLPPRYRGESDRSAASCRFVRSKESALLMQAMGNLR
jgi:hypothetical protein